MPHIVANSNTLVVCSKPSCPQSQVGCDSLIALSGGLDSTRDVVT